MGTTKRSNAAPRARGMRQNKAHSTMSRATRTTTRRRRGKGAKRNDGAGNVPKVVRLGAWASVFTALATVVRAIVEAVRVLG